MEITKTKLERVEKLISTIERYFNVDIKAKCRKRNNVSAKKIFCYLCVKYKLLSLTQIGSYMNTSGHWDAWHHYHTMKGYIETNDSIIEDLSAIEELSELFAYQLKRERRMGAKLKREAVLLTADYLNINRTLFLSVYNNYSNSKKVLA